MKRNSIHCCIKWRKLTGSFSQNVSKLLSELKLVTDNLLLHLCRSQLRSHWKYIIVHVLVYISFVMRPNWIPDVAYFSSTCREAHKLWTLNSFLYLGLVNQWVARGTQAVSTVCTPTLVTRCCFLLNYTCCLATEASHLIGTHLATCTCIGTSHEVLAFCKVDVFGVDILGVDILNQEHMVTKFLAQWKKGLHDILAMGKVESPNCMYYNRTPGQVCVKVAAVLVIFLCTFMPLR